MPRTTSHKISVVLVAYNRGHLLSRTIDSLLAQTVRDFELIISDDCSTDDTEAIARAYERQDARVRYRRNQRNLGMPENLNAGIRAASGEFVANLHDGDVYDPRLLEKWLEALARCEKAAFVFNAYRLLAPDGRTLKPPRIHPLPPCFPGTLLLESIFFRRWQFDSPVWGTVMARRSAYDDAGLFDSRFGFCSDVDMWLRLAEKYHVAYVKDPLISLPPREELPSGNPEAFWHQRRLLYRMFWEARMRHFAGMPLRQTGEILRHGAFVMAFACYHTALALRRFLFRPAVTSRRPPSM